MKDENKQWFPSPHSGILFLSDIILTLLPTIGAVSVPSFGDSFFIEVPYQGGTKVVTLEFPSPHSGILFLSAMAGIRGYRTR